MRIKIVSLSGAILVFGFLACKPQSDGVDSEKACKSQSDCLVAQLCRDKICRDVCNSNSDCMGSNQVCDDGACMPRVADAGAADRLLADTSLTDLTGDSAQPDRVAIDRFTTDSVATDRVLPDSRARDLVVDRGVADSSQPDTAVVLTSMERYLLASCQRAIRCQPTTGRLYSSLEACLEWYTPCPDDEYVYDETNGDQCRALLDSSPCGDLDDPGGVCYRVIRSTTVRPIVGAGQSCAEASCEDGLFCQYQVSPHDCPICVPRVRPGQACTYAAPSRLCQTDSFCNDQDFCELRRPDGYSCENGLECESRFCRSGSCSPYIARGRPCTEDDYCANSLVCVNGVCDERRQLGESCNDDVCTRDATCNGGQCKAVSRCTPGQIGQACKGRCVTGAYCDWDLNECYEERGEGEICYSSNHCTPETFCKWIWDDSGLCTTRIPMGQSCIDGWCVEDGYNSWIGADCTCRPIEDNGGPCFQANGCTSFYCNSQNICAPRSDCFMP